ncbi:MAG TPA: sporulation integral membrane protein YtvI [Bacillota bacterium]|nr:sporulation integral membrane protein YtvI [Bacillota bacterium]
MKKVKSWQQYIGIGALILLLLVVFNFRSQLAHALVPFFLAVLVASIIEPMIGFFQKKLRISRGVSAIISLFIVLLFTTVIFTLILVFGVNQIWKLASSIPRGQQRLFSEMNDLIAKARDLFPTLPSESVFYIETTLSGIFTSLQSLITRVLNSILSWAVSIPNVLIIIIITILSSFFIAKDRHVLTSSIVNLLPKNVRKDFHSAAAKAIKEIIGFLKGQLLLSLLTFFLSSIFLGLILRNPYWMILSVVLAILDVIPVLGPGLILIPWSLVELFFGSITVFWITTILNVGILVTRQTLQPIILGDSTGIHPLLMLFSIYAGLMIFGVWGLFLGPIIVIVVRAFFGVFKRMQKGSSDE